MQSTSSLLCLPLYFFDRIFKIVRIRLCISDSLYFFSYSIFLTFDSGLEAAVVTAIRAAHVDQHDRTVFALFFPMCRIVFLLDMFQPAIRRTIYKLFFVGDRIFAPPAV